MYFEPVKKTYYRFPSRTGIQNFDEKHYFPDKPYASGENTRFQESASNGVNSEASYATIK